MSERSPSVTSGRGGEPAASPRPAPASGCADRTASAGTSVSSGSVTPASASSGGGFAKAVSLDVRCWRAQDTQRRHWRRPLSVSSRGARCLSMCEEAISDDSAGRAGRLRVDSGIAPAHQRRGQPRLHSSCAARAVARPIPVRRRAPPPVEREVPWGFPVCAARVAGRLGRLRSSRLERPRSRAPGPAAAAPRRALLAHKRYQLRRRNAASHPAAPERWDVPVRCPRSCAPRLASPGGSAPPCASARVR